MRRSMNKQNVFILVSIIFIVGCIINYGGRFIYFYLDSKKDTKSNTFAATLKTSNMDNDNFKVIQTSYYFMNDDKNNYVYYSGILWRIVKIDSDNKVYLISDNSLTSLAFGENKKFSESYIKTWLNGDDKNKGILKENMNTELLTNVTMCLDVKEKVNNSECKSKNTDYEITLLDMEDYINIGSTKSFVNNGENFYLANLSKDKVWYVDQNNGLATSDGTDVIGVKAVIALKGDSTIKEGKGTKEEPYSFDEQINLGAYVKLGNDIWRVYEVSENKLKLHLDGVIKDFTYPYSNKNYGFDDTVRNTLAYYLNHTYLGSLSYKKVIEEDKYSNGYYGSSNDYDYISTRNTKIPTKVGMLGVGDIVLSSMKEYSMMSGINKSGSLIYVGNTNATLSYDDVTNKLNVTPCITIKRDILTIGKGTKDVPYEME